MSERKCLVSILWATFSLALLASVLFAPIPTSGSDFVPSRPDCLRRLFAQPVSQPATRLSAATTTDVVPEANAFPAEEDEERDGADALDEPRIPFLIPCSFCKVPDRRLIAPLSILSHYPLRC